MNIQQIQSPGGIKAWLVEEHSVPLISLKYAFDGGNSQDPAGKAGVANFITAMMDEGAGDLKSEQYQERMEDLAMRMSYDDTKDSLYGSFETLTANRDKAAELLKLSVQHPRFDRTPSSASVSSSSQISFMPIRTRARSRCANGMRRPLPVTPMRFLPAAPLIPSRKSRATTCCISQAHLCP